MWFTMMTLLKLLGTRQSAPVPEAHNASAEHSSLADAQPAHPLAEGIVQQLNDALDAPPRVAHDLMRHISRQRMNPLPMLRKEIRDCRQRTQPDRMIINAAELRDTRLKNGTAQSLLRDSVHPDRVTRLRDLGRLFISIGANRGRCDPIDRSLFTGAGNKRGVKNIMAALTTPEMGVKQAPFRSAHDGVWAAFRAHDYETLQGLFDKGLNPNFCFDYTDSTFYSASKKLTLLEAAFYARDSRMMEFLLLNGATLNKTDADRLLKSITIDVLDRDYRKPFSENISQTSASLIDALSVLDHFGVLPKIQDGDHVLLNGLLKSVIMESDSVSHAVASLGQLVSKGVPLLFENVSELATERVVSRFITSAIGHVFSKSDQAKHDRGSHEEKLVALMTYANNQTDETFSLRHFGGQECPGGVSLFPHVVKMMADAYTVLGDDGLVKAKNVFGENNTLDALSSLIAHPQEKAFQCKLLRALGAASCSASLANRVHCKLLIDLAETNDVREFLNRGYPHFDKLMDELMTQLANESDILRVPDIFGKLIFLSSMSPDDKRTLLINENENIQSKFMQEPLKGFMIICNASVLCMGDEAPCADFFEKLPEDAKDLSASQSDVILHLYEKGFSAYLNRDERAVNHFISEDYDALAHSARRYNIDEVFKQLPYDVERDIRGTLNAFSESATSGAEVAQHIINSGYNRFFTEPDFVKALNTDLQLASDTHYAGMIGGYNTGRMWDDAHTYVTTDQPMLLYRGLAMTPEAVRKWAEAGALVSLRSAFAAVNRNTAVSYSEPQPNKPESQSVVLEILAPSGSELIPNIAGEYVLDSTMLVTRVSSVDDKTVISGFMIN
jgi:hypothetical protein